MPFITQGKTNIKYLLIVVALAAIVGGGILGYYYLWIKDLESRLAAIELKLPKKVIKDETANWKTYRNEELGFYFSYPEAVFGAPKVYFEGKGKVILGFEKSKDVPPDLFLEAFGAIGPSLHTYLLGKRRESADVRSYCVNPLQ